MNQISEEEFYYLKLFSLQQAAAYIVCRETEIGFFYPNIWIYRKNKRLVADGEILGQFKDQNIPLIVDWAMSYTEHLSIIKNEEFDPELGGEIPEAIQAKNLVNNYKYEIIELANELLRNGMFNFQNKQS